MCNGPSHQRTTSIIIKLTRYGTDCYISQPPTREQPTNKGQKAPAPKVSFIQGLHYNIILIEVNSTGRGVLCQTDSFISNYNKPSNYLTIIESNVFRWKNSYANCEKRVMHPKVSLKGGLRD